MKPLFSMDSINERVTGFVQEKEQKTLDVLFYTGEKFVNRARDVVSYTDRTGNLRSSIGYTVFKDGKKVKANYQISEKGSNGGKISKKKAMSLAQQFANEVGSKFPKGYVVVGVAGMNYAFFVEKRNYDVISGSAPTESEVKKLLDEIK